MKLPAYISPFVLFVFISLTTGCLSWEPGWKAAQAPSGKGDAKALIGMAEKLTNEADSKDRIEQLLKIYNDALKIDPNNREVLNGLATCYYILAYCYNDDIKDKKTNYIKAVQFSERAMYTNPEFKALADKGEPVWEACRVLGTNDLAAMMNWYHNLGNYWSECMSPIGQVINYYWTQRANRVLERLTAVDEKYYSGNVYFTWAIYYTLVPGFMGGDMKKAGEYFDKALAAGPHMINVYASRAQYYDTKMKDRNKFIEDLHHALAIDPHKSDSLIYPWAIWHQRKAAEMLKDVDKYFK